jgi:hypothetical protein
VRRVYPCRRTLYVDVDGVLLIGGQINEPLAEHLRALAPLGWTLVIWSGAGAEHATTAADAAGLSGVTCLAKPDAVIDDAGWSWVQYKPVLGLRQLAALVEQERAAAAPAKPGGISQIDTG